MRWPPLKAQGMEETSGNFFGRIASTIYRVRQRWNCPGLLSLHWVLRGNVEQWAEAPDQEPFAYECNVQDLQLSLKHNELLWRYTAYVHALFQANRTMWTRLPWNSEFSLDVPAFRVGIEILPRPEASRASALTSEYFPRPANEHRCPISMAFRTTRRLFCENTTRAS